MTLGQLRWRLVGPLFHIGYGPTLCNTHSGNPLMAVALRWANACVLAESALNDFRMPRSNFHTYVSAKFSFFFNFVDHNRHHQTLAENRLFRCITVLYYGQGKVWNFKNTFGKSSAGLVYNQVWTWQPCISANIDQ